MSGESQGEGGSRSDPLTARALCKGEGRDSAGGSRRSQECHSPDRKYRRKDHLSGVKMRRRKRVVFVGHLWGKGQPVRVWKSGERSEPGTVTLCRSRPYRLAGLKVVQPSCHQGQSGYVTDPGRGEPGL